METPYPEEAITIGVFVRYFFNKVVLMTLGNCLGNQVTGWNVIAIVQLYDIEVAIFDSLDIGVYQYIGKS